MLLDGSDTTTVIRQIMSDLRPGYDVAREGPTARYTAPWSTSTSFMVYQFTGSMHVASIKACGDMHGQDRSRQNRQATHVMQHDGVDNCALRSCAAAISLSRSLLHSPS